MGIITGKDKGDSGCDVNYGHGIVQAKTAFEYLEANQCDPNESFKEPEGGCAEFSCIEDSDCDDGNPDTINTCVSGACQTACASDASCDDNDPCTNDSCTEGVCSNVLDCSNCGGVNSVLELTTDNYPGETEWDIKNSSGDEKYNGSGYSDANTLYTINMCLESDEYTFKITDAYGDGICCSYGNGGYVIKVDGTEVVNGGEFGDSETETFTVTAPPTAPVSPPTAPVSPPTAPVSPFKLTSTSTSETSDHEYECKAEFGNDYEVADWYFDLVMSGMSDEEIRTIMENLGIPISYNENFFFVTYKGNNRFFGSIRVFFFEDHNYNPPGNWLAHDTFAGLTLGSWYNINNGKVLCKSSVPVSPPTAPVSPPSPVTAPAPTPHPTGKAPTPWPTHTPPTPYPTGTAP